MDSLDKLSDKSKITSGKTDFCKADLMKIGKVIEECNLEGPYLHYFLYRTGAIALQSLWANFAMFKGKKAAYIELDRAFEMIRISLEEKIGQMTNLKDELPD